MNIVELRKSLDEVQRKRSLSQMREISRMKLRNFDFCANEEEK